GEHRGYGLGETARSARRRDDDHAAPVADLGAERRAGGARCGVSRGSRGPGRTEGPARADAHASSLGRDAAAADVRRPPAEPVLSARAEPGGTRSGLAVGPRLPGEGSVDDPGDGPASSRSLDAG